jgi:hypothetical protein
MSVIGFLNPTFALFILIVGLLSGVLSVMRDVQGMYWPSKVNERKTFWVWARIAFVVAAILLWADEHSKVGQLESELALDRPQMRCEITTIAPQPVTVYINGNPPAKFAVIATSMILNTGSARIARKFVL